MTSSELEKNDCRWRFPQTLLSGKKRKSPFAAITALQTFGSLAANSSRWFDASWSISHKMGRLDGVILRTDPSSCSHNSSGRFQRLCWIPAAYSLDIADTFRRCVMGRYPVVGWNWPQIKLCLQGLASRHEILSFLPPGPILPPSNQPRTTNLPPSCLTDGV